MIDPSGRQRGSRAVGGQSQPVHARGVLDRGRLVALPVDPDQGSGRLRMRGDEDHRRARDRHGVRPVDFGLVDPVRKKGRRAFEARVRRVELGHEQLLPAREEKPIRFDEERPVGAVDQRALLVGSRGSGDDRSLAGHQNVARRRREQDPLTARQNLGKEIPALAGLDVRRDHRLAGTARSRHASETALVEIAEHDRVVGGPVDAPHL